MTDLDATRVDKRRLWAGGQLLIWTPGQNGARKSFTIPIDAPGRKQIHVALALTPQSPRVTFRLDGRPLQLANRSETADLYRPYRTLLRSVALTPVELTSGDHTLTLELKDAREHIRRPEIGIDFIWVQRK